MGQASSAFDIQMKTAIVTACPGHKIRLSKIDPNDTGGLKKAEALEQVIKTPRTTSRMPTLAPAAKPQSDVGLIREYDALATDEQRRAFWKKHEKAIEGAKIGGLILVSMMSAKPFSMRARLELPTSERELVLTPGEFRGLSGYDKGKFLAQGGKVQPAKIKRSLFSRLHPRDQMALVKDGGRVID